MKTIFDSYAIFTTDHIFNVQIVKKQIKTNEKKEDVVKISVHHVLFQKGILWVSQQF